MRRILLGEIMLHGTDQHQAFRVRRILCRVHHGDQAGVGMRDHLDSVECEVPPQRLQILGVLRNPSGRSGDTVGVSTMADVIKYQRTVIGQMLEIVKEMKSVGEEHGWSSADLPEEKA